MNIKTYVAQPTGDTEFSFLSQGRNGSFEIRTCFEVIDDNLFDLAFGPWDEGLMGINDRQELRNGDMDIILATVANIAINFLETHPKASIYATGLTLPGKLPVRTRKYQMGIRKKSQKEGGTTTPPVKNESANRPLSKKAQEAKLFLERNPIPKEFLNS
jgi:hypothetical protein